MMVPARPGPASRAASLALAVALAGLLAGCAEDPAPAQEAAAGPAGPLPELVPVDGTAGTFMPAEAKPSPQSAEPAPGLYKLSLPVAGGTATGLLAVPEGPVETLVVVAHGWGADAELHRPDLEALAGEGTLAVALDFRGDQGAFKVRAGVEDVNAVTLALQRQYPSVTRTLLYGWSMGGEIALLAPLEAPPGTYDYLFAGAGVMDLALFWHTSPFARAAIEAEAGGPPTDVPDEYAWRSPLSRVEGVASAGVARIFLVHAAGDWVVPIEHSERMYEALEEAGQPVSFYVVTKDRELVCELHCVSPPLPAGHTAGRFAIMQPFIGHRIERQPDPSAAAVRGTYDGDTGHYDPSDVG